MFRSYVIFDVNYLAWRAFYSTGQLSNAGDATGVIFGVLRELQVAKERFAGHRFVFCFDHARGLRELVMPGYKATRRAKRVSEEEAAALDGLRQQVTSLKFKYLERLGYNNVFFQSGYEADDYIAAVCQTCVKETDKAVIYSDDKDLYQLLRPNVSMWKPRTGVLYTMKQFVKDYGIQPQNWARVKAIAGCSSDDVPGVPGVGEKTAVDYLNGNLKTTTKKYLDIVKSKAVWRKNIPIVRLPLTIDGAVQLKPPAIVKDDATPQKWDAVAESLGMSTLAGGMPGGIDRKPLLKV